MKYSYCFITVFLFASLTTCKGKSASDILQLLCGRGEHKSQMTVGLNLDTIKEFFSLDRADNSPVLDADVQEYLNSSLAKFGVSESTFNIQNVESVKEGDNVRFLQLGGVIGEAFGASASFLKETFASSGDRSESNPFDFINESFGVRAAAAEENYRKARVQEFFETYLPFLVDNVSRGHAKQWAYEQTDLQASVTLFEQMIIAAQAKFPNQINIDSNPIVVAVLDTGVDIEHNKGLGSEDLNLDAFYRDGDGNIIGYNATSEGGPSEFDDENGHGTHCAGIIASRKADPDDDAPLGVASMANTKIMPIKVLTKDGAGGFQAIEKGVRWAMHNGAKVLSMSLGAGLEYEDIKASQLRNKVFEEAIEQGIIIVVAAGNENCPLGGKCSNSAGLFSKKFSEYTVLPCAYDQTICVGASNADETLANYSNHWSQKASNAYRTQADINAPGTAIYSTWPISLLEEGTKIISGTSMATPFVAGVAALIKTVVPNITQAQMLEILQKSQAYPESLKEKSNTGRLDLHRALLFTAKNYLDMTVEGDIEQLPPPKEVAAPEIEEGSGGSGAVEAVSSLWGAVCQ